MTLPIYQVDAFAEKLFEGNPAAIVPLEKWLPVQLMQKIAMENNLAETAYFVPHSPNKGEFDIRWFTPESEINLCGHATLASAYVLYNFLGYNKERIVFNSQSGPLRVSKEGDRLMMDFPSWKPEKLDDYPTDLLAALGNPELVGVYKYRDLVVELNNEDAVRKCNPDFTRLKKIGQNVVITAPGKEEGIHFVSRFFAPHLGIEEDPVTGSGHSQLIPFWSYKLGLNKMVAKQLSKRGGKVWCEQKGDRVIMGGECRFYLKGEITVDH